MKRITAAMDTPHAWHNISELELVWIAFRARSLFYRYMSFRTTTVETFRGKCILSCMKILISWMKSLKRVLKINVVHSLTNQVQLMHKPISKVYSCNWVVTNHSKPYKSSHKMGAQLFLLCYVLLNLPVIQVFIWLIPHILQLDTTGIVIIV